MGVDCFVEVGLAGISKSKCNRICGRLKGSWHKLPWIQESPEIGRFIDDPKAVSIEQIDS